MTFVLITPTWLSDDYRELSFVAVRNVKKESDARDVAVSTLNNNYEMDDDLESTSLVTVCAVPDGTELQLTRADGMLRPAMFLN